MSTGSLRGSLVCSGESPSWRPFTPCRRLVEALFLPIFFAIHPDAFFEPSLREMKSSSELRKGTIQPGCWESTNTRPFSARAGRTTQVPHRACIYTITRAAGILPIVRRSAFSLTQSTRIRVRSTSPRLVTDNWREHVPTEVDAPPDYFRHPYPAPTWTQKPSHLSGLVLALPNFLPRSPNHSPEPSSESPSHSRRGDVKSESARTFRECCVP